LLTNNNVVKELEIDIAIMNSSAQTSDIIEAPELSTQALSGRATWDDRGNSVWEWQTAPGVYSREISSQQLQALEAADLHLEDALPKEIVAYSSWKRGYANVFTRMPSQSSELVMPNRRKEAKTGTFDRFLKRIGLPA